MATMIPEAVALWAADAVKHCGIWLQRQAYTDDYIRDLYREAVGKQKDHAELAELLRSTGDAECLACAARYEAAKAEK